MGAVIDLGRAIAAMAEGAPAVRALVSDPAGGVELRGVITAEISDTHVRLRADDGLVWAVAKRDLTFLCPEVAPCRTA